VWHLVKTVFHNRGYGAESEGFQVQLVTFQLGEYSDCLLLVVKAHNFVGSNERFVSTLNGLLTF
jgi:hypothetical protein